MVDWAKIRTEYIKTGLAYRKLAAKYNISFNTLKNRAIKEKWVELRKQKENKTTTKTIESLSDKESEQAVSIQSAADLILKRTSELLNSAPATSLESLKTAASTLKILKEVMDIKGDADMREQEARIAKLQREAEDDTPEDREVNVTFTGDLEQYSK